MSETTTSSQRCSASRTRSVSGRLTAGLVAMIHTARTRPAWIASNRSTALSPGSRATAGLSQNACTASAASKPRWPARVFASPPTSRPPMALGWPVSENGPAPGRPTRPVARWQLRMAPALSVPLLDWFTPWENRVSVRGVAANQSKNRATSASTSPQARATSVVSGALRRAAATAASSPPVWASTQSRSIAPVRARWASRPLNSHTSVPGRMARCRSASRAVSVVRGSMTTMRRCGSASRASRRRR
ncbi:hypothetical protein KBTX_03962 [wastewater metagenome]|uniref:Uncharacterized protein n=2 Tax=unclassified sequences TaxID=12908 RepID=A0A5B8RHV9_9ZZZZ|nr:hypothetical protein KBTEX_03962 [uncultured organism]